MENIFKASEKSVQIMQELIQKSWADSKFKSQLIKDPIKTIQNVAEREIVFSKYKNIIVEDQTDNSIIYFNIPAQPNLDELELNEYQLEQVAGGISPTFVVAGLVVAGFGTTWALDQIF